MSVDVQYVRVNERIVKATLTLPEDAVGSQAPLVVLDRSGSMAGSRIRHCCGALEMLLKLGPVRLITYNDRATDHGVCARLPDIRAEGYTDFCAAWEAVIQSGDAAAGPVIFMTDGEDRASPSFVSRRAFFMQRLPKTTQIFCVGIESESNTQALLDLAKASPIAGEYTFFSAKLHNYTEEAQLLARQTFAEPVEFRGAHYHVGREPVDVYFEDADGQYPRSSTAPIDYVAYRADALVKRGTEAPLAELQALHDEAQALFTEAGRLMRTERKLQRQRLMPVFQLITQFYELRHKNHVISHEQLAQLALKARDARSSRFAKLAVNRAERNLAKLSKQDAELEALASKLDAAALAKLPQLLRDEQCVVSCKSAAELLADADCIGVGLRCNAREVCIADATLLEVQEVGASMMGCGDFLEAREWAADEWGLSFQQPIRVLSDGARVNVNAVLPLYLCPEHWELAQHWVDRMAADAACRDPTQGSRAHTFYTYLLAWRAARPQSRAPDDHFARVAEELRQVLKRLSLAVPTPEQFLSIEQRLPDVTRSLPLLALAYEALELAPPPAFALLCAEEQLRRDAQPVDMAELCRVPEALIAPYVEANLPRGAASAVPWSALRATLSGLGRADAVAALDSLAAAGHDTTKPLAEVPDAQRFATPPVRHCLPDSGISAERAALMALQAWRHPKASDCAAHYEPLYALDEAAIAERWRRACVEHLELRRQNALSAALQALHKSTVDQDLRTLEHASLLEWAAVLHAHCYIGRNVNEYACAARRLEHVEMLCGGRCDVGALLGVPSCVVATLRDKSNNGEPQARWTPSVPRFDGRGKYVSQGTQHFRGWREAYGVELLRVLPHCACALRPRHWLAALKGLRGRGLDPHAEDFWPRALEVLGLPPIEALLPIAGASFVSHQDVIKAFE